jgi:hypothetical protein
MKGQEVCPYRREILSETPLPERQLVFATPHQRGGICGRIGIGGWRKSVDSMAYTRQLSSLRLCNIHACRQTHVIVPGQAALCRVDTAIAAAVIAEMVQDVPDGHSYIPASARWSYFSEVARTQLDAPYTYARSELERRRRHLHRANSTPSGLLAVLFRVCCLEEQSQELHADFG